MSKLGNYAIKFNITPGIAAISTAFLKNIAIVVGDTGIQAVDGIHEITDKSQIAALTSNTSASYAFDVGLSKIFLITLSLNGSNDDLERIKTIVDGMPESKFYSMIISEDFTLQNYKNLDVGTYEGVVSYQMADSLITDAALETKQEKRCIFIDNNNCKGAINAFASLMLSQVGKRWSSQQYIDAKTSGPFKVTNVGTADSYYNDRVSFYMQDENLGTKLAGFFQGGREITYPYIIKQLILDTQSIGIQYLAINQPNNTFLTRQQLENSFITVGDAFIRAGSIITYEFRVLADNNKAYTVEATAELAVGKPIWRVNIAGREI